MVDGQRVAVVERDGSLHALPGKQAEDLVGIDLRDLSQLAQESATPIEDAELVAPLRPGKIVAIGLNYMDHVRETGLEPPAAPLIFAKFPSAVIGDGEAIEVDPDITTEVDWEVELAAVIGRRLKSVPPEEALTGVFGYTVANDVSARDIQFSDQEWERGKNLDTFCPLGPMIVTADEVGDPQRLRLRTLVNGELVQDSTTAEMVFGVADVVSYCSRYFTLEPGDVILTGTPHGSGHFRDPQRYLKFGDQVEVEVEGVGTMENPVVRADAGGIGR